MPMSVILRKCKDCGLEAHAEKELEIFSNGSPRSKHGKTNLCKPCNTKRSLMRYRYSEYVNVKNFFNMIISPLRKCKFCGLEAWEKEELGLFESASGIRGTHGKYNVCKPCYSENYIKKETSLRRMNFKNQIIRLNKNPRTNVCSTCGKSYPKELSTQTHLHHTKYDEADPLKYIIELCNSCHTTLHWKLGKHINKTYK